LPADYVRLDALAKARFDRLTEVLAAAGRVADDVEDPRQRLVCYADMFCSSNRFDGDLPP
jgi:hypothetical protein